MKLSYRTPGHRLPDDISYFIDGAAESLDVSYDIAFWMHFMCPNIGQLVNGDNTKPRRHPEDEYIWSASIPDRVRKAYNKWFENPEIDIDRKLVCLAVGTSGIRKALREASVFFAERAIQEHNEYDANPPALETKIIRTIKPKAFKTHEDYGHDEVIIRDWKAALSDEKWPHKVLKDINSLLTRIDSMPEFPEEVNIEVSPVWKINQRRYDKKQRQAIAYGLQVLSELIGKEAAEEFVKTRTLEIPGEKFSFRLKLEHMAESHGSVKTQVLVKGEPVCNLCIYTPETPALDHVANLILQVQAGFEDEIIKIGNPYNQRIQEPTGIEVLDKRLTYEITRERIVVRSARPPEIIRVGASLFTRKLQKRMAHRITNHLYQNVLGGRLIPKVKLRYNYPKSGDECQLPASFVVRTIGELNQELRAIHAGIEVVV